LYGYYEADTAKKKNNGCRQEPPAPFANILGALAFADYNADFSGGSGSATIWPLDFIKPSQHQLLVFFGPFSGLSLNSDICTQSGIASQLL